MGIIILDPVILTLEFDPFFEIFNLAYNFCTVSAKSFDISHEYSVIRPSRGYHYFVPCDLDLGVWPILLENFNLGNNFWTVSA